MNKSTRCVYTLSLFDGKRCSVCKNWKHYTDFAINRAAPDALSYFCRDCRSEIHARRMADPVKQSQCRDAARNWLDRKKSDDEYMQRRRAAANQWHVENKDRRKAWFKDWSKSSKSYRARVKINKIKRRDRVKANGGIFTVQEWISICNKYGNICLWCRDAKPLTADHVIPLVKGGSSGIENIQPLCAVCNSRKHDKHIDFRKEFAI